MVVGSAAAEVPELFAAGEWSKPVVDSRGYALRGRLVIGERRRGEERREVAVYVELQDASEAVGRSMRIYCDMGKTDFRPENKSGLQCELRDKQDQIIPSTGYPFGGATPKSDWVTLPSDSTIRLRASPFGIHRANALAISPQLNQLWVIDRDDPRDLFLSGTFTIAPPASSSSLEDPHIWRGTIDLPPAKIRAK